MTQRFSSLPNRVSGTERDLREVATIMDWAAQTNAVSGILMLLEFPENFTGWHVV
jgi:hypothetical protein